MLREERSMQAGLWPLVLLGLCQDVVHQGVWHVPNVPQENPLQAHASEKVVGGGEGE